MLPDHIVERNQKSNMVQLMRRLPDTRYLVINQMLVSCIGLQDAYVYAVLEQFLTEDCYTKYSRRFPSMQKFKIENLADSCIMETEDVLTSLRRLYQDEIIIFDEELQLVELKHKRS